MLPHFIKTDTNFAFGLHQIVNNQPNMRNLVANDFEREYLQNLIFKKAKLKVDQKNLRIKKLDKSNKSSRLRSLSIAKNI